VRIGMRVGKFHPLPNLEEDEVDILGIIRILMLHYWRWLLRNPDPASFSKSK
jgi:hypothetical protein